MKNRVILMMVFSSLIIGKTHAQCDTFKRVDFDATFDVPDFIPPSVPFTQNKKNS